MNTRLSTKFGLLCSIAFVCTSSQARAEIEQDIVVNGGTLDNPVGVGFGYWEGLQSLKLNLGANPGRIAHASTFAPESVIWSTVGSPDPWVFKTAAILPNAAFAVKVRGTLEGITGTGEFAVAASDVDLECDSLNRKTPPNRTPSWSDAEDGKEFPENGSGGAFSRGMVVRPGDDWALLQVKGHLKRSGVLYLQAYASALANFEFADQAFNVLGTVETKGGFAVLFKASVSAGSGPWTFYVRPAPNSPVAPPRQITVRARFVADNGTPAGTNYGASSRVAIDQVLITIAGEPPPPPPPPPTPATIEIIDAQAFSPNSSGGIDGDPTLAINGIYHRTGVFADGTSVLVMRLNPLAYNGPVTFELQHSEDGGGYPQIASYNGSLSAAFPSLPAPDPNVPSVQNTSVIVAAGDPKVVYFRPPNNFLFDASIGYQDLTITAYDQNGDQLTPNTTFRLVPPTIVLVHGVASDPSSMEVMMAGINSRGASPMRILMLDWSDINISGYDTVAPRVYKSTYDEVRYQRARRIAATRLDFVGHSMGGIIVKWYAANMASFKRDRTDGFPRINWTATPFLRGDNFGVGDVRRFISIDTPFGGSPIADEICINFGYLALANAILRRPQGYLKGDGCALDDFGTQSPATTILAAQPPRVSWLPIQGMSAPGKTEADLTGRFYHFLLHDLLGASPSDLGLDADNSDFVVPLRSQIDVPFTGLIPPNHASLLVSSVTHEEVESHPRTIALVGRALLGRSGYKLFNPAP
jgi:pimeloyl-ACP methyl ester carboxylesterase